MKLLHVAYYRITFLLHRLSGGRTMVLAIVCVLLVVLIMTTACLNNSGNNLSSSLFFPVQKIGLDQMDALLVGKLELDNGYLRMQYFNDNYLLIWPYGFSLLTEGEEIQVINRTGQLVARLGTGLSQK